MKSCWASFFAGLVGLFLLFFLRMVLRNDRVVLVVWVAALTLASPNVTPMPGANAAFGPLAGALAIGAIVNLMTFAILKRLGLIAAAAMIWIVQMFALLPITLQASAWYAGYGYAALAVVAATALYGFRTSLGGRPLIVGTMDD